MYNKHMRRSTAISFVVILIIIVIIAIVYTYSLSSNKQDLEPGEATSTQTQNIPSEKNLPVTITEKHETSSTSPDISYEYPQFPTLSEDFNASISAAVNDRIAEFKKDITGNEAARKATSDPKTYIPMSTYSFLALWQPAQTNSRYVSFIIRFESYTGGANENQDLQTFNYDVTGGKPVSLADLFPGNQNYLSTISKTAREQLTNSLRMSSPGYDASVQLNPGTEPTLENFKNFTFIDPAITFYFPKYQVAPGAFGEQKAIIQRK